MAPERTLVPELPCVNVAPPPIEPVPDSVKTPVPLVVTPLVALREPVRLSVPALTVVAPVKVFVPPRTLVPELPCENVAPPPIEPAPDSVKTPVPLVVTPVVSLSAPVRLSVPAATVVAPV